MLLRRGVRARLLLVCVSLGLAVVTGGHPFVTGGAASAAPNPPPLRTGPPPAPTHPVLAAKGPARPGQAGIAVRTLSAPLVPMVRAAFGHRVHYAVEAYLDAVHTEPNGAQVFRSSRPHSVGSSPELAGANAAAEFVGRGLLKDPNPNAVAAGYAVYKQRGIKVVVDLRSEATPEDRERATTAGLEYVNVKLQDNAIFNPMVTLLGAVNAVSGAAHDQKSVVIHCEKGIGRTGLVAAAFAATRHPEWTENDVVQYAEDRGLELMGQKRALQRFWRALLAGDIVVTEQGVEVPVGRTVGLLDSYEERPNVSRSSAERRWLAASSLNVKAPRPYRVTEPRGVMEAMTKAAARSPSTVTSAYTEGNKVTEWPLVGNSEIGRAARELIESAEHEVLIETMIFADSVIVHDIKAGIQTLARTRPNVPVYIRVSPRLAPLLDRHGSYREYVETLFESPNVIVGSFDASGEGEGVGAALGLHVSHSKTIVADNRRALVTDANLEPNGDRQVDNPGGKDWFQTAIVFEGPAAAKIREQSAGGWSKSFPAGIKLPEPPSPHTGFADGVPMLALGQRGGAGRDNAAHQAFLAGFTAAVTRASAQRAAGRTSGERIMIMTPNLNDKDVLDVLAGATEHLHVHIVLTKGYMDLEQSMPGQGGNNNKTVEWLANHAKDPTKLHIRWFGEPTVPSTAKVPAFGHGLGISHAKPILVGDTVWMGSRNLDTQSTVASRELDVVVQSRDVAAKFYRLYRTIWHNSPVAFEATPDAGRAGDRELAASAPAVR